MDNPQAHDPQGQPADMHWQPQPAYPPAGGAPPPPPPPRTDRAEKVDQHWIAYSTLMLSLGIEALAAGTFLHLVIESATQRVPLGGGGAALSLTLALFALPFLFLSVRYVTRLEKTDPAAKKSAVRGALGYTLLVSIAIVGPVRLFWAIWNLVNEGLLAPVATDSGVLFGYFAQIVVAASIAGGLGWTIWCWLREPESEEETGECPSRAVAAA